MRKITEIREFNVYKFDELSQAAKEKVRDWYLEGQSDLSYIFTEDCENRLAELFPNSDLKVQYSLSYCQGDGFNIYGEIQLDELLEKIAEKFTEKELKFFKWAFSEYDTSYTMKQNNHYCYCICSDNDLWKIFSMKWITGIFVTSLKRHWKNSTNLLENILTIFVVNLKRMAMTGSMRFQRKIWKNIVKLMIMNFWKMENFMQHRKEKRA